MVNDSSKAGWRRWRKRSWAAILVVVAGVLFAGVYPPCHRAQRIADAAALAGASELWLELRAATQGSPISEDRISARMLAFATGFELEERDQLIGYYLDAEGNRLAPVGSGIPQEARGIEAVVTVRVRILGVAVWSVSRESRMCFDPACTDEGEIP